jgi:hypothetical protein
MSAACITSSEFRETDSLVSRFKTEFPTSVLLYQRPDGIRPRAITVKEVAYLTFTTTMLVSLRLP